jgi:hypothetical protein
MSPHPQGDNYSVNKTATVDRMDRKERKERNAELLRLHLAGQSMRELGAQFDMSAMGVKKAIDVAAEIELARVALRLTENIRTGQIEYFAVPDRSDGLAFSLAITYVNWVVKRLEERNLHTRIHIESVTGGFLFGLTDADMDTAEDRRFWSRVAGKAIHGTTTGAPA